MAEVSKELKTALETLEGTFTTQQKELGEKLEALGAESTEFKTHRDQVVTDMADMGKQIDEVKAAMNRAAVATKIDSVLEKSAERKAFEQYVLNPKELSAEQKSSLAVSDDSQGGYFVNPVIGETISQLITEMSPMKGLVSVRTITSGDAIEHPTFTNKTVGAVRGGETTDAADANTIAFGSKRIVANWLRAMVPVTMQAEEDIDGIVSMISGFAAEDFALTEGNEILNGSAPLQAKGILQNSDIGTVNTGSITAFSTDTMLELVGELKAGYRAGASFIANRVVIFTELFTLKDGDDRNYLVPDFRNGLQFTLLGYPLIEAPYMPSAISSASKPLVFGNFKRAYQFVERKQLSLFVDPYTGHPTTKYKWAKRSGGDVVVPEALKIQVTST